MAEFYLDNDVSLRLAPMLRAADHLVITTRDRGSRAATDNDQLLTAARNSWILVSHNRDDFTMLHDAWLTWPAAFGMALPAHAGVLVLDHAIPSVQFDAILTFAKTVSESARANGIFWWHRRDGWRRRIVGQGWEPMEELRDHAAAD